MALLEGKLPSSPAPPAHRKVHCPALRPRRRHRGFHLPFQRRKGPRPEEELTASGGTARVKSDAVALSRARNPFKKSWRPSTILINNAGITRDTLLMRMSEEQGRHHAGQPQELLQPDQPCFCTMLGLRQHHQHVQCGRYPRQRRSSQLRRSRPASWASPRAAFELGSRNIRCNAIAPGFIETGPAPSTRRPFRPARCHSAQARRQAERRGRCLRVPRSGSAPTSLARRCPSTAVRNPGPCAISSWTLPCCAAWPPVASSLPGLDRGN